MTTLPALLCSLLAAVPPAGDAPRYERRWFYARTNLQVKEEAEELARRIGTARAAGYNGVVLADYKLNFLDRVPEHYFTNLKQVRKAAEAAGVEIIPAVFPIGYSNGLLAHDPNLAEGFPVVGAPFVVRGGEAVLDPRPAVAVANGDLEDANGDTFRRFGHQDEPGVATFADRKVAHHGTTSLRIDAAAPAGGNRRIIQGVAVRPHASYRLSAWVKTEGLTNLGAFRLLAIGAKEGGRSLTFYEGGIEATQDWRRVEIVFNSLDYDAVNLYAGLWGGGKGMLWLDELSLEEIGPINVLRRPGCPFTVTSDDGATTYAEGRDFERFSDPKLGNVPYAGEFETGHAAPPLRLTAGSRLRDGQRLRVSWYHPALVHGSQIMCCPSEPKTYELLRDQARRVAALLRPRTYFMSHDEIRVMNWCGACTSRKLTPGQLLADNVKRCTAILKEINPKAEVVVWSDMFDPNHNAVDGYYLVNGTLAGSWEGLAPQVSLANWNGDKMRQSLEFFSKRGHRQILAGYYDADDLSGFTRWDEAARGVRAVDGFMYTTWENKFRLLQDYGRAILRAR